MAEITVNNIQDLYKLKEWTIEDINMVPANAQLQLKLRHVAAEKKVILTLTSLYDIDMKLLVGGIQTNPKRILSMDVQDAPADK